MTRACSLPRNIPEQTNVLSLEFEVGVLRPRVLYAQVLTWQGLRYRQLTREANAMLHNITRGHQLAAIIITTVAAWVRKAAYSLGS